MAIFGKKKETVIIAGLGNPGDKYVLTRHNMGFRMVDALYDSTFTPWKKSKDALIATGTIAGKQVMLVKPQKFMNLSGEVLRDVLAYYKADVHNLIVGYDDIDLPAGQLRIRKNGGAGTHNGMRNILLHVGQDFARIRMGVGKPQFGDLADFVLAQPKGEEADLLEKAVNRAREAAELLLAKGIDEAMNQFNRG